MMMNFIDHRKIVGEKEIFYNEAELNSEAQSRLLPRKTLRGRKKKSVSVGLSVRTFCSSTPKKKQREFEFECEEKAKVKRSYSNPQKKE